MRFASRSIRRASEVIAGKPPPTCAITFLQTVISARHAHPYAMTALAYKYFNQEMSRRRALSDANQRTAGNSTTASTTDVSQTPHMWSKPK